MKFGSDSSRACCVPNLIFLLVFCFQERQAKKDEEIVRTLQARILNEEWARRETLERLQEEQKTLLEAERKKREEFERLQNDKEQQLRGNVEEENSRINETTGLLGSGTQDQLQDLDKTYYTV